MQFRNFFKFIVSCCLFFIFLETLSAQRVAINRHGEKIIIMPEGTWEHYDEKNSQHREILKAYEKELKKKQKEAKATADTDVEEELSPKGEMDDSYIETMLQEYIQILQSEEDVLEEYVNDAKFSRILIEEQIEEERASESPEEDEIALLEKDLKIAEQLEEQAIQNQKNAKRELKLAEKINESSIKKKREFLAVREGSQLFAQAENPIQLSQHFENEDEKMERERANQLFAIQANDFRKYKIEEDVMYNPPTQNCSFEFDGVDEFLGKKRKDVRRDILFTYSDERMLKHLEGEDYLKCEANLTGVEGGVVLLNLFITIKTQDAPRAFGKLNEGSMITLKMIDDSKVKLVNTRTETGMYNKLTQQYTYTTQYLINSAQEKSLRKGEIDKVRVIWETGFEDYEVYNLDFFKDQFNCLKGKNK